MNLRILSVQKASSFVHFFLFLTDIFVVICPEISYMLQVIKFYKTKSSDGFSKFTCLIFFTANICRIFFWIGKRFKTTLLFQSIGIASFQVYLIYLCVKFDSTKLLPDLKILKKSIFYYLTHWSDTFNLKKIWKWSLVIEYYKFMAFIIFILILLTSLLKNSILYDIIGTISAGLETMICVPQIIENFKTKNTKNVSCLMIFVWMLGDILKFLYNLIYKTPIQMIVGALIQVLSEMLIMFQFLIYGKNSSNFYERKNVIINKQKGVEEINILVKNIDEGKNTANNMNSSEDRLIKMEN